MTAKDLTRLSITLESELLQAMNRWLSDKPGTNRSEFIRDLIRGKVYEESIEPDEAVWGVATYIYDHHQRELDNRITEYSHNHHEIIISSMHLHLDEHHCLEIVALKGSAQEIKEISDQLLTMKGVSFGRLSIIQNRLLQSESTNEEE